MRPSFCAALALLLCAGCDYVVSEKPVGESPVALEEAEWAGTWLHGDGSQAQASTRTSRASSSSPETTSDLGTADEVTDVGKAAGRDDPERPEDAPENPAGDTRDMQLLVYRFGL